MLSSGAGLEGSLTCVAINVAVLLQIKAPPRMSSAAATSVLASMAALQGAREDTGDFTMTCRGATLKAHAHVLSMGWVPASSPP